MVGIKMRQFTSLLFTMAFFTLGFGAPALAQDSLLFEAYYRVMKSGSHVGYYIMKHEFDAKKKQFQATTFLKIEGAEEITESVKATATTDFKPLSYTYTAMGGGQTRTVDAKVTGGKLTATINANGKNEKVSTQLNKGSISSQFLIYAILSGPQGLKAKTKFAYVAVAEELAKEAPGTVDIIDYEDLGGTKALRLENDFLGTKSSNFVTEKGEILRTVSPTQKISVEIVATSAEAFGTFKPPTGLLKSLFGAVPEGKKNPLAAK